MRSDFDDQFFAMLRSDFSTRVCKKDSIFRWKLRSLKPSFHLLTILIIRHIIPIKRIMLHFRPRRIQHPSKHKLNILNHVTSHFNMSHIRRMVLGCDIIMLHNSRRIEIMHKRLEILVFLVGGGTSCVGYRVIDYRVVEVGGGVEVLIDAIDLGTPAASLFVGVADGAESFPKGLGMVN